jgi:hypothetical protein
MSLCFGFDFNFDSPVVVGFRFVTNKFTQSGTSPLGEGETAPDLRLNSVMFNVAYTMDW